MSGSDRRQYLSATEISQDLLDACHDNLEIALEMICEIESPGGVIRLSDRNKYVGGNFYEARMKFPVISRTAGEWLSGEIQFQTAELELSNVDGKFNSYLPGGADFEGWVGRSVVIRLGLGKTEASYRTIFSGKVTEVGGFKRSTKTIRLTARDDYDFLNDNLPKTVFTVAAYPDIEEANQGKPIPIIYGDWTTSLDPDKACVPAFVLNGNKATVTGDPRDAVELKVASHALLSFERGHVYLQRGDSVWQVAEAQVQDVNLVEASFKVAQGGSWLTDSSGSSTAYQFEQGDNFFVRVKGKDLGLFSENIVSQAKDLLQSWQPQTAAQFDANWEVFRDKASPEESAVSLIKSRIWLGDQIPRLQYVLSLLEQVRLEAFIDRDRKIKLNSLHLDDFVNAPAIIPSSLLVTATFSEGVSGFSQGDISSTNAVISDFERLAAGSYRFRLRGQEPGLVTVRIPAGMSQDSSGNQNQASNQLSFSKADSSFVIKNWDVVRGSFELSISDEKNAFNRGQAAFDFRPNRGENAKLSPVYRNQAAITQQRKSVAKKVVFPNLFDAATVSRQFKEILKLSSSGFEIVSCALTWRAMLLDIGDFVRLNVKIGSTQFDDVPCMIRDIGYDPEGFKVVVKMWSLQMVPFGTWQPGYDGTVGGTAAVITEE
ncbi:hypothetical protein EBX31_06155 [bacterium]|nr:hypothetical protein [bacterium]